MSENEKSREILNLICSKFPFRTGAYLAKVKLVPIGNNPKPNPFNPLLTPSIDVEKVYESAKSANGISTMMIMAVNIFFTG